MKWLSKHWPLVVLALAALAFAYWWLFVRRVAAVALADVDVITGDSGRSEAELDEIIRRAMEGDGT